MIQLAIPVGAADYWVHRLNSKGIEASEASRFGLKRVLFNHPCGIPHELVENPSDKRPSIVNEAQSVFAEHGIKGIYGAAIAVWDRTSMDDFLTVGMSMRKEADSEEGLMFSVPNSNGPASMVEVLHEPNVSQGTWTLAGGTIHHLALNSGNEENQFRLKAHLEGLGFTDVSDQKNRNYFKSCYVRSPGGALFEIAWTVDGGWAVDEPSDKIGSTLVFPPWFESRKDEIINGLEPAVF
ncbi:glyoxalase [Ensifer sp. YR511]|uniref:glyoxalase n=1 Tax=Ensifer sp. YR511 TaxID=1855294 RepID=UPI00088514DA|nr:glyoxalase [Ensifer sp. YR511]SDN79449.1 glyoxalase family protein [Ensifer sp. YR511]